MVFAADDDAELHSPWPVTSAQVEAFRRDGYVRLDGVLPPDLLTARSLGPGEGFAALDSARGRLYHRVRLDWAGRIVEYAIVAPTEWNFHPDGPFVQLLRGAWIGSGAAARRRVERLAFVFDPCVGIEAKVRDVVHA